MDKIEQKQTKKQALIIPRTAKKRMGKKRS